MIRKLLAILVVTTIAIVAIEVLYGPGTPPDTETDDSGVPTTGVPTSDAPGAEPNPALAQEPADGASWAVPPPAGLRQATVSRLADGDSFDIRWSDDNTLDEIRLLGINAPERDACFGSEARTLLGSLIDDQALLVDGVERDEFGRVLADVWVGDVFVNAALVAQGAALALSGDGRHSTFIAQAQREAEQQQSGLWSPDACRIDGESSVVISTIEFDAPGRDNERPNEEWIAITNVGSDSVDLSGWSVRDESTRNRFSFPTGFRLNPGETVRVRSGCGTDGTRDLYWCARDPVWTNTGDRGFLVNPQGQFVDTFAYVG